MKCGSPSHESEKSTALAVEDIIGRSLRWGVVASAVIIALGLILLLATGHTGYPPGFYPTRIPQVLRDALRLKPFAVIDLGLLLLIATPIFRVAASVVAFIWDQDLPYVLITLYVLTMLLLSLVLGKAE
ncbi:MAG: DUF1634 domain-containing protein [Moorellaceae bacterium]